MRTNGFSDRSVIKIFFFLVFISGLFGVFGLKQLLNDGSIWAYDIFEHQTWHYEPLIQRFSTRILQTPAVMASKLSRNPRYTVLAFCMSYFVYPFIAFFFLWKRYRNHERKDVLYIPLLTFFLTIIPCWAFSVAVVPEAIVMFWFFYCSVICEEEAPFPSVFVFSVMLFYTYEIAVLFYPLAALILWREKKLKASHLLIFVVLLGFQVAHLLTKVMPGNGHQHFRNSLLHSFKFPVIYVVPLFLVTFAFYVWLPRFRKLILITGPLLLTWPLASMFKFRISEYALFSYVNRTWALPASILIFYIGYEVLKKSKFKLPDGIFGVFSFFCIPALLLELSLTYSHTEFSSDLKKAILSHEGCTLIDQSEWDKINEHYYVADWTLPYLSILHGNGAQVKSILIPPMLDQSGKLIPNDCALTRYGQIRYRNAWNEFTIRKN